MKKLTNQAVNNSKQLAKQVLNSKKDAFKGVADALKKDFKSLSKCIKFLTEYLTENQSDFLAEYKIDIQKLTPSYFKSIDNRFKKGNAYVGYPHIKAIKFNDVELKASDFHDKVTYKGTENDKVFNLIRKESLKDNKKVIRYYEVCERESFSPMYLFSLLQVKFGCKKLQSFKSEQLVLSDIEQTSKEFEMLKKEALK